VTELCGVLKEDIRLPALVRFVTGLGKSGCLRISEGPWIGELSIDAGRVVAASFGPQRGLVALDAMALALPNGQFAFSAGSPAADRDVDLDREELQAYLGGLATKYAPLNARIPSLAAVPWVIESPDQPGLTSTVTLDRSQLAMLLAVDGRRTVGEIAAHRGLIETVSALASLTNLGLIRVDLTPPAAIASPTAVEEPPPLASAGPCPKLGFADEPARRYSRPTQLHCCFAGASPERISVEEQHALCLTDRFAACARLNTSATPPAALELGRMRAFHGLTQEPPSIPPVQRLKMPEESATSRDLRPEEPTSRSAQWRGLSPVDASRPALTEAATIPPVHRPRQTPPPDGRGPEEARGARGDFRQGALSSLAEPPAGRRGILGACASGVARKPIQTALLIVTVCIAVLASAIILAGHLPLRIECCTPPFLKAAHLAPHPAGEVVVAVRLRGW
jgi:hypothetical protein